MHFQQAQTSSPCRKKKYAVALISQVENHAISAEPRIWATDHSFQKFKPHNMSAKAYTKLVSSFDVVCDMDTALP